jgi:hypothetical protein
MRAKQFVLGLLKKAKSRLKLAVDDPSRAVEIVGGTRDAILLVH